MQRSADTSSQSHEPPMEPRQKDRKRDPDGGQSTQDQWKQPTSRGGWKEVSIASGALGLLLKEQKSTWQKSCKNKKFLF